MKYPINSDSNFSPKNCGYRSSADSILFIFWLEKYTSKFTKPLFWLRILILGNMHGRKYAFLTHFVLHFQSWIKGDSKSILFMDLLEVTLNVMKTWKMSFHNVVIKVNPTSRFHPEKSIENWLLKSILMNFWSILSSTLKWCLILRLWLKKLMNI